MNTYELKNPMYIPFPSGNNSPTWRKIEQGNFIFYLHGYVGNHRMLTLHNDDQDIASKVVIDKLTNQLLYLGFYKHGKELLFADNPTKTLKKTELKKLLTKLPMFAK